MFAGARWPLGPVRLVLLLASLSTLPLLTPPAVAQSLPGTPDPTLLPVATTLQVPLTAAYNALNVPALAAGTWYLDPTTQIKIYKLTSATYPAASANWGHDYAEGGDEVSLPYSGNTRAVLVRQNGGVWWLVDFTPGVGVSNPRQLTGNLAPFMDLTFTFSNNPATPYYAYVSRGSTIYRFDIRTMTEAPGNGWPVTGETLAMWLHQSENDGFFVWMRGANGDTIVGYEPATGTKKTYTNANLNEPRIDRAGRYVGISMAGNGLVVWDWNTSSVTWSTPGDPGIPFAHNASLKRRWLTVDWNMSYPPDYGMFISDVPNSGQHIAGPANGTLIHGNGNWIQQPANLDDQWALFTHYGSLRPPESYWLAPGGMVLITPNGQRRLLGHPYNTTSNYTFFSFAKFAPDGKYVLFTSNMNGSGRSDLFLAELPQTPSTPDITPPTASLTAPASGATISGTIPVLANASDDVGVVGVQFQLDGANLGAEDTSAPYSISWNTTLSSNGSHTLTAVARDAAGNPGTSSAITVTVSNPDTTPPTVSLASPLAGATVSGIVTIVATASDNVGVAGVQFKLDGVNLGPELVLSPYLFAWPTTTAPNGSHTLTAVARDAAGNTTTSSGVTVTVANLPPTDGTPPVISAVVASALTASGATITWTTDEASDSQVEYGPTTAYGSVTPLNTTLVTAHSQTLSGLAAGTVYHYRVKSRDAAGNLAVSGDFTFATLASPDLATGLVGWWRFDEGSGTTATDASGNGHTGTLLNGPTWAPGELATALAFDGVDDHVQVPHASALNAYPLTVAVWIKTSTTAGVRGIVNKYLAGSYNGYQVFMNGGNLCAWYLRDAANYVYNGSGCTLSTAGVNDNQWHHVVFVVDAAGGRLYVDGTQKAGQPWTGTAGALSTLQPVHLAHYPGAFGGAEYFSGLLDDVRIYARALSTEEVAALYWTAPDPDITPPTLSAITASLITGSGATITWATDEPADSQVEYGTTTAYGASTLVASTLLTSHAHVLTGLAPSTLYHYRGKSRDAAGNLAVSGNFSFTTGDTTPPAVSLTVPSPEATVAGPITVSATASDNVGVAGVQFKLDGANLGAETTVAPYTISWNTATAANGAHTLTAVARDAAGNTTTSGGVTVTVSNDTAPPVLSAVTASALTASGATITWTTDEASDSHVEYGPTTAYGSVTPLNTTLVTAHSQTLSGLAASTLYHYRVKSRDAAGNLAVSSDFTFSTPASGSSLENVIWTNLVNATATGNTLQKTAGCNGCPDAGATSQQQIPSGSGYVEFTAAEAPPLRYAGLSTGNTGTGSAEIKFAIRLQAGIAEVRENGIYRADVWFVAGDRFRVGVESGAVRYYKNGTLFYMSAVPPTYPLLVDTSLFDLNGTVANAVISGSSTVSSADTSPPAVSITAPVTGTTVAGTLTVSASGSDNVGIVGVQFKLDGTNLGAEATAAPYSISWDTRTVPDGTHTLTAVARDAAGNVTVSSAVTVTVSNPDTTPPTVSIASPLLGATVSGTITVAGTAADNVALSRVEIVVDGGAAQPASGTTAWTLTLNTLALSNGTHTIVARAVDSAGNLGTASVSVTVFNDTTAPAVSLTSPLSGATVSGTTTVAADASDNVGIAGVQFKLDGLNLGAELTLSPYVFSWNTATATNGAHTLTAVARDAAGIVTTSGGVTVTVSNDTTPPVLSAVTASGLTALGATITWTSNEASDSQVEYGSTTAYGTVTPLAPTLVTVHAQTLSGLAASTLYHYRVKSRDAAGNLAVSSDFTFTTPGNLLLNGGFEDGQVGWTNWSSTSRFVTTLSPYTGSSALQINVGPSNRSVYQTIPATAGRTYTISMALRTSLTKSAGRGRIQWLNSSGSVLKSLYFGDTIGNTPWTVKTTTQTAPSGTTQLRVSCWVTAGGSGSAWFDAVEVR